VALNADSLEVDGSEPKFQWSIQRSIKVKSLPSVVSDLVKAPGSLNLVELEDRFNLRFSLVKTVGVAANQRPFMRTMDFLKNDLLLLNDDYTIRRDMVKSDNQNSTSRLIYYQAMQNLVPFRIMVGIFKSNRKDIYPWKDFKEDLSREMILEAKTKFARAFKEKEMKLEAQRFPRGIYGWEIEDNSLNRLVELGMLFGICSFVVLQRIRFISEFQGEMRTLVDFDDLIRLLKEKMPSLGPANILTFDEIYQLTDQEKIPREVVEDALLSGKKNVTMFTGGKEDASSISVSGKNYYSVRFNERCFS
jgi:hypothetical protein